MRIQVSEMAEGQQVKGVYLVRNKNLSRTRAGKPFLTLRLGDRSGEIESKVWDDADRVFGELARGDVVEIAGQVGEYNGKLQLTIQRVRTVDAGKIDPSDFLPASERNPDEMMAELQSCIRKVQDADLRKLLQLVFRDGGLKEKLRRAPAAKAMHHAYLGGLLEHTLSLFQLCERVAPHFPEIDRDLLRVGALLHDIGKVDELSYERSLDYSDRGRLLGHISIELEQVSDAIRSIRGFPEEKAILVKHLLLSHHGKEEFGSPVKPMILEALILHMLDDLDAKAQVFRGLMKESSTGRWSPYHSLLGQFVFKGFGPPGVTDETGEAPPSAEPEEESPTLF